MKKWIGIISCLIFFSTIHMQAQNLLQHQWKNRLLVIHTSERTNETYEQQLEILRDKAEELEERKLLVYRVHKNRYAEGLAKTPTWKLADNTKSSKYYAPVSEPFEITLIGLDGGVKMRQNALLHTDKLFSTIDVMPMRRQEIDNKR
jgi:hypothetical protein